MKNTYTILTEKKADVEKKLHRLEKKALKYGVPFSAEFGEPYCMKTKENLYEVVDLTLETEIIKKDGYSIVAYIEHGENANVVQSFTGTCKADWMTLKPFCAHCNANHNLKYTFIVKKDEEEKQVGKTCLMEYCGIDPQKIGIFNQFVEELEEYDPEMHDYLGFPITPVYDTIEALAMAIDVYREQGYIRSNEPNSNKSVMLKKPGITATEKALQEAKQMASVIMAMDYDTAIDARLNNVLSMLKNGYCKFEDFGYIAYAPVAYERHLKHMEMLAKRAQQNAELATSEYVGKVGERLNFDVREAKLLTSFETYYGTTHLYRFIDANGNVLIWFTGNSVDVETMPRIKATVKEHSERDGVKQTILTRVKKIA